MTEFHNESSTSAPGSRVITVGFVLVLGLLGALTLLALSSLSGIHQRMDAVASRYNTKIDLIVSMRNIARERSLSMYAMLHTEDLGARFDESIRFSNMAGRFIDLRRRYEAMGLAADERRLFDSALTIIRSSQPLQQQIVERAVMDETGPELDAMLRGDIPLERRLLATFDKLVEEQRRSSSRALAAADLEYRALFRNLALLGLAALLLGAAAGYVVRQRIRRMAGALFREKEQAEVTLYSIAEGVITTDAAARVRYINPVAEQLTGWSAADADGRALHEVYRVVDESTHLPIDHPAMNAPPDGRVVGVNRHSLLLARSGREFAVEDSSAPIRDRDGRAVGTVLVFRDVTEARDLALQLGWQASHDALTGLVNRFEFELLLRQLVAGAGVQAKHHALLYIDLDQFKVVNDTCGHVAGDALLRRLADMLQTLIRESDTLARLGGDEFAVLLEGCDLEQAGRIADKLLHAVQEFRFMWEGRVFAIGASIGLVPIGPDTEGVDAALSAADSACYMAKERGRNRVYVLRPDDSELRARHGEMQWISRLNSAFDHDRFVLYGQPIVPLCAPQSGAVWYELLIRMLDERGRLIAPMAFIPAAERFGAMARLDRWVVTRSLRWLSAQRAAAPPTISVNISTHSLSDDGFLGFVITELRSSGVEPAQVCFEITETSAIANWNRASQFIRTLKEIGCRFALDDFGSGMSSFGYLKNLPVDYLKIDGTFVRDMVEDRVDFAMVEAINRVGQVMGMGIIAESVENQETLERLAHMGVDFAQGFYIRVPEALDGAADQPRRSLGKAD